MPMSPWLASAGCRKKDGLPVLARVDGNLVADMPGLAHAGDDDAAFAGQQQPAGQHEFLAEPVDEGDDSAGLGGEHAPSAGDELVG